MNKRMVPWTIEIANLATRLRVGIWEHERAHQPVTVNLSLRGLAPHAPSSIDDCLNYEPICRWLIDAWPEHVHTPLLETKLLELLDFIFDTDPRIDWVDAAIAKPEAFQEAHKVGVRMAVSRAQHAALLETQSPRKPEIDEHIAERVFDFAIPQKI